jgi:hypothetical protein
MGRYRRTTSAGDFCLASKISHPVILGLAKGKLRFCLVGDAGDPHRIEEDLDVDAQLVHLIQTQFDIAELTCLRRSLEFTAVDLERINSCSVNAGGESD